MKNLDMSAQFSLLRARIEDEIGGPAVVSVTSAKRGDGKTLLAFGLAKSLADADFRVLFVNANPTARRQFPQPEAPRLSSDGSLDVTRYIARQMSGPDTLSLASEGVAASSSGAAVGAMFDVFRKNYDYIVICLPELTDSNVAVSFARKSDAMLVALRLGRKPAGADHRFVASLQAGGIRSLGVVTMSGPAVDRFAKDGAKLFVANVGVISHDVQPSRNRPAHVSVS